MMDNSISGEQPESVYYVWSEYALSLRPSELASMLSNPRVRSATAKTRCNVEVTRRVLNRRQFTSQWAKYSIVRITGPDDQSISQCNRLLERAVPIYQHRREYSRRAPVTLYSKNVEAEGDFGTRRGDTGSAALLSADRSSSSRRRASSESETGRGGLSADRGRKGERYPAGGKKARSNANSPAGLNPVEPVSYKLTDDEPRGSPFSDSGVVVRSDQNLPTGGQALSRMTTGSAADVGVALTKHSRFGSDGPSGSLNFRLSPNQTVDGKLELSACADDPTSRGLPRSVLAVSASYSTVDQPTAATEQPVVGEIYQQAIAPYESLTTDSSRRPHAVLTVKASLAGEVAESNVVKVGLVAAIPSEAVGESPPAISEKDTVTKAKPCDSTVTPTMITSASQHVGCKDSEAPCDLSDVDGTRSVNAFLNSKVSGHAVVSGMSDGAKSGNVGSPCEQAGRANGSRSPYGLSEVDGSRSVRDMLALSNPLEGPDCSQIQATRHTMEPSMEKAETPCDLSEVDGSKSLHDLLASPVPPCGTDQLHGLVSAESGHAAGSTEFNKTTVMRPSDPCQKIAVIPSGSPCDLSEVDGSRSVRELLGAASKPTSSEPRGLSPSSVVNSTLCQQTTLEESEQTHDLPDTHGDKMMTTMVNVTISMDNLASPSDPNVATNRANTSVNEQFNGNVHRAYPISGIDDYTVTHTQISVESSVYHTLNSKQVVTPSIGQQMTLKESEVPSHLRGVDGSAAHKLLTVTAAVSSKKFPDDSVTPTLTASQHLNYGPSEQPRTLVGMNLSPPAHAEMAAQKAFEGSGLDGGFNASGHHVSSAVGEQRQTTQKNLIPPTAVHGFDQASPSTALSVPTSSPSRLTPSNVTERINLVVERQLTVGANPSTSVSPCNGVLSPADSVIPLDTAPSSVDNAGVVYFKLSPNQEFNKIFQLPTASPSDQSGNIQRTVVAIRASLGQACEENGQPAVFHQGIGYDVLNNDQAMLSVDGGYVYADPLTGKLVLPSDSSPNYQQQIPCLTDGLNLLPASNQLQASDGAIGFESNTEVPTRAISPAPDERVLQTSQLPMALDHPSSGSPYNQFRIERRVDIIANNLPGRNTLSMGEVVNASPKLSGAGSRPRSLPESSEAHAAALSHSPVSVTTSISTNLEVHVNRETGKIDVSFEINGTPVVAAPSPGVSSPTAGQGFSAEWNVKLERNATFGPIGIMPLSIGSPDISHRDGGSSTAKTTSQQNS